MFDDDFKEIAYSYFKADAIIETATGTYADRNAPITPTSVTWNHGLNEVLNSLIQQGLGINSFDEFDYPHYNCFNETEEIAPQKFRIKHLYQKIPMLYALKATKKAPF